LSTVLSEEQARIVRHPEDQHAVVLAVAGSGKSTTMAERIAYLIEARRVEPNQIVAVMFNSGAAEELGVRMARRLGKRNAPASMTYHRLGTLSLSWLVRDGLAPAWEFIASVPKALRFARGLLEAPCKKYGHKYPGLVAEAFMGFVDRVKSDLTTPRQVWQEGEWQAQYEWFVEFYPHYERARERAKVRFFSDLIYDPVTIMSQSVEAARLVADRYKHIIVDEYQDICESQQALLRFVAGKKARVMVVGDDDQTIYTWRGAKPSYILRDFHKDFPGAATYQLTRTWRYGHALSCAANYLITGNKDRAAKLCISGNNAPNTQVRLVWDDGTGSGIVERVNGWVANGGALTDIAILVRAYSRSGSSQFAMLQSGVPFRLEGGESASVLENRWVKALLCWLELAAGTLAERPYAGDPDFGSIMHIRSMFDSPPMGLSWEGSSGLASAVLKEPQGVLGFSRFVGTLAVSNGSLAERVMRRAKLWQKVRSVSSSHQRIVTEHLLGELLLGLDVKREISKTCERAEDAEDQWRLVEAFVAYAGSRNETLREFLMHIADLRSFSERSKNATQAIHVTSIHRSKGLEWPCVFMIGLSQGAFPMKPKRKLDNARLERHLEDERRLFYVGMTRAKHLLYLFAPEDKKLHKRAVSGMRGAPDNLSENGSSASQFLYESNLSLANRMPDVLRGTAGVRAVDPEIFNEYLGCLGRRDRIATMSHTET